jgi:Ca2+-transporting ATPase
MKATGVHTAMGAIGRALQTVQPEETPLQRDMSQLVRWVALISGILCMMAVVGYGLTRGQWFEGMLAGIALAMAILPNEFPVVLVIFLALGAWRISYQRVLTRRIPAVEALGAATVLCVDKTGTLTLNRMAVRQLRAGSYLYQVENGSFEPPPEAVHELVEFSLLASQRDPFDPMEQAIRGWGEAVLAGTEHLHADWLVAREYPLSAPLLAMSLVWRSPQGPDYVIAAKGAPEAIADLCHLGATEQAVLIREVGAMADEGLRVLAVAKAAFTETVLPPQQHDFEFSFLGLIGLADPLRPEVPAALRECHGAGIRVLMLTGDYPGTARSIARQLDLRPIEEVLTGTDIEYSDELTLQQRLRAISVCARILPTQKLRIVNALKHAGDIVAMTGDGVNDASALRAAHIGVAMGRRGTDVAREAADLVLLDDDFASLVATVRLGRRIFDNLKKAMAYLVAVHVPIAGMSLLPVLFRWPLVLMPVHIAFLHLIIDPVCSVVFENEGEEADVMSRPPRDPYTPLFGKWTLGLSMLQGFGILAVTAAVFGIAFARGQGEEDARALTFTTLIVANVGLVFSNRAWSRGLFASLWVPNRAVWWVTAGTVLLLALVLYVPGLRMLFRFSVLHPIDLAICLAAGVASTLWFEALKRQPPPPIRR